MKKIGFSIVLLIIGLLLLSTLVFANKPVDGVHDHDGDEGKDWHEWCHDHWDMGHSSHASWYAHCNQYAPWPHDRSVVH